MMTARTRAGMSSPSVSDAKAMAARAVSTFVVQSSTIQPVCERTSVRFARSKPRT